MSPNAGWTRAARPALFATTLRASSVRSRIRRWNAGHAERTEKKLEASFVFSVCFPSWPSCTVFRLGLRIPGTTCTGRASNPGEHQAGVGAAEAEAVRHDGRKAGLAARAQDRKGFRARIEFVDIGRAGHEAALHHEQAV